MNSHSTALSPLRRPSRAAAARVVAAVGLSGALLVPAVPALAHETSSQEQQSSQEQGSFGDRVVAEASRHDGKDYTYGATGPDSFDCSGYVQYVFRQLGVEVPRTSRDQYAASQKVAKGEQQLGDLIAIHNSEGRVTHVGIFAGDNSMWVASSGSDRVRLQSIYTDQYNVGRFG